MNSVEDRIKTTSVEEPKQIRQVGINAVTRSYVLRPPQRPQFLKERSKVLVEVFGGILRIAVLFAPSLVMEFLRSAFFIRPVQRGQVPRAVVGIRTRLKDGEK